MALKDDLMGEIQKISSSFTQAISAEIEERKKNMESIKTLQTEHQTSFENLTDALNMLQEEKKFEFGIISFDHSTNVSTDVEKTIKLTVETLTKLIKDSKTSIRN